MNKTKFKKISSGVLIVLGAVSLIIELASGEKNYYLQSIGIVCLMMGLFIVNSTLTSRSENRGIEIQEEEEQL